nr:hypothetical protein [Tanacetum cinerariifolium]
MSEGSTNPTNPHHTSTIIQPSTYQPKKTKKHGKPRRKVIEVPQPSDPIEHVTGETVNKEMDDSLKRAATIATSLDTEWEIGNIFKTRSKATSKEPGFQRTSLGGGPRCQETMGDTVAQTRSERVSKISNDPLLVGVNTSRSGEDDEGLGEEDASKQGRIADIDANEDIYLVNVHYDEDMFGVNDLDGDEVIVENVDVAKQAKEVVDNITLPKALMEIKSVKPKANKVVIQEPEQGTNTTTHITITVSSSRPKAKGIVIHEQEQAPTPIVSSQQPSHVKDRGKDKMVEPEHVKKLSNKDQLMLDEELAFKLQVEEEEEEERIAREKA